ncbi:MAG TPA: DUF929 family protein [Acidimicrobiales bacterium]|jgi:hypothetical protein|nr:DUF929 family protein [Acidimicrobiales bacterium]
MAENKRTPGGGNTPKPGGNTPKPGVSAKDRSRQQSRPVSAKAAAKKSGPAKGGRGGGAAARPPVKGKPGARPRGPSGALLAWGAVAVVIVVVVVLVVVKVTSGGPASAAYTPVTPAPSSVVSKVTSIPDSVYNQVGVTSSIQVSPPIPLSNQPVLMFDGKPGVLYVGAEYCPYCAAERWALIASLSRFGTFSNLKVTASSQTDVDPSTHTFSFEGSTYTSPYLTFQAVEQVSNIPNGQGYYKPLDRITKAQQDILNKYEQPPLDPNATAGQFGYPFVDIGNQAIVTGPSYNPGVLAGLTQSEIANGLSDPSNPVTQAIVTTSNYITAAICTSTKNVPASVCQSPGVQAAATALAAAAK